jgi:protein SCO1
MATNLARRCTLTSLLLLPATFLAACDRLPGASPPVSFRGVDITGANYANQLSLKDVDGKARSLDEFKGKVLVVFFGFTQCPDVCPSTLAELAEVKRRLGPAGERVQGIFVTIDPDRDTAELLRAYVGNFDPSFIALRGSTEETAAAAKNFKVFYAKSPGRTEGSYTMDHTAGSYLFDAQGRVRVFTRYGTGPDMLQHDLTQLLAQK